MFLSFNYFRILPPPDMSPIFTTILNPISILMLAHIAVVTRKQFARDHLIASDVISCSLWALY